MKKLLTLLLLAVSFNTFAQVYDDYPGFLGYDGLRALTELEIPDDTTAAQAANTNQCRKLAKKNDVLYQFSCTLGKWVAVAPVSVLDSVRRSNDTLYFRTTSGEQIAVKLQGIEIAGVNGLQDSLDEKLNAPLSTNNSLNALVVVDGQNKTYIRSTDSLPFIKNQFAGEQGGAEVWVSGRIRSKGSLQRIDDGTNQASLIDWLKSDASTIRGRIGYWNSGVFGSTDTWGALNFLGPAFLAGKKDSTVALGTIDGATISTKLAIRGQNMFLRRSGMIVDLNGALLDSLTGVAVTSPYFFNVSAGADNTSASFSGGVRMRRLNADTIRSLNGAPVILTDKFRLVAPTNSYPFDIKRDLSSQGLALDAGGGVARYNSYDSTNAVWGRHYFESTKGSTTKVLAILDANTDRVGIGPGTTLHTFFQVQGAMSLPVTTVTGNTTLNETHFELRVNNSGSVTITPPSAAGITGRIYCVKKLSAASNDVVITGVKTLTLLGSSVIFISNGTSWDIIGSHAESTVL
ncbi:hypothetical protein [Chitinophaga sp. YIM B06452]|uniref:hypothetical protein n=1 Tax=Chitinophaga sp. YIM B06452 TaxID=3082158 RepID=UPI0031FEE8EE